MLRFLQFYECNSYVPSWAHICAVRDPISLVNAAHIRLECRETPLVGLILILSKMYRGIMHAQLKWRAVLQTKILPKTCFDPQKTGNYKTGSNWLEDKYTAKIWKIKQQSFREHCVSTAGTRVLSDTLSIMRTWTLEKVLGENSASSECLKEAWNSVTDFCTSNIYWKGRWAT